MSATATIPRPAAVPEPDVLTSVNGGKEPLRVNWSDELTVETAPTFRALIGTLLLHAPRDITLDLTRCRHVSEEGAGALNGARVRCLETGVRLRLVGLAGQPKAKLAGYQILDLFA